MRPIVCVAFLEVLANFRGVELALLGGESLRLCNSFGALAIVLVQLFDVHRRDN